MDPKDELARAIAYLYAKEVAPERYAFKLDLLNGPYITLPADLLDAEARLRYFNGAEAHVFEKLRAAYVRMPAWWTPEEPYIVRNRRGYFTFATLDEAKSASSYRGDNLFTANLETGEEIAV